MVHDVKGPDGKPIRKETAKHPDNGGNPNANRWQGVWIGPDGTEKTATRRVKDEAKKYARKMEEDLARGEYIDPAAGNAIFDTYGQRWLASRAGIDPASVIRYESMHRLHIQPKFGKRKVGSIKPSEVQAFLAELSERYEASTPITALLVLQGILDLAVADEKIKKNPAKADIVKAPAHAYKKVVPWPDLVVLSLIAAHPGHLRAMPVLGAGCGMRAGEWFGIALEDVDFDEMTIHVRRQVKKLNSEFVFALPKRDKERTIPMSQWVADHLRAHIDAHPPPYTLPWELSEYLGHADPALTLRVYAHMLPSSHDRVREAIDRQFRRPGSS